MKRKDFLKTCGLYGLGIVGMGTVIESCKKNNNQQNAQGSAVNFTLDLSQPQNASLNTPGGSVTSNGVVVANSAGTYICVAETCTHEGCNVDYRQNTDDFFCPCHSGVFDKNGSVTSGPPPAPLKSYNVTKNGNILTIS